MGWVGGWGRNEGGPPYAGEQLWDAWHTALSCTPCEAKGRNHSRPRQQLPARHVPSIRVGSKFAYVFSSGRVQLHAGFVCVVCAPGRPPSRPANRREAGMNSVAWPSPHQRGSAREPPRLDGRTMRLRHTHGEKNPLYSGGGGGGRARHRGVGGTHVMPDGQEARCEGFGICPEGRRQAGGGWPARLSPANHNPRTPRHPTRVTSRGGGPGCSSRRCETHLSLEQRPEALQLDSRCCGRTRAAAARATTVPTDDVGWFPPCYSAPTRALLPGLKPAGQVP